MTAAGVLMLVLILGALIALNLCLTCRLIIVRMLRTMAADRPIRRPPRDRG